MNAWRQVALAVVSFFASMTLAILLARDAMLHAWTPFHFLFVSITVLLVALNAVQVSWCVLPSCTDPCVVLTVQWSAMLLCTALLLLCAVPSTPGRNRISPWLFETAVPATVLLTVLQGVKVSGVMEMEKTARCRCMPLSCWMNATKILKICWGRWKHPSKRSTRGRQENSSRSNSWWMAMEIAETHIWGNRFRKVLPRRSSLLHSCQQGRE